MRILAKNGSEGPVVVKASADEEEAINNPRIEAISTDAESSAQVSVALSNLGSEDL